jgi:hypothetical protein
MSSSSSSFGVLLMVKDEQETIALTLHSICPYVDHVILYDTGSQDKTIPIAQQVCQEHEKKFSWKQGDFTTFPESRNKALEFAETFPVDFLLLMDAGDEFQTTLKNKSQIISFLKQQKQVGGDCFLVCQEWLDDQQRSSHYDIRVIRNQKGLRYDIRFPVHEKLKNVSLPVPSLPPTIMSLYQNRDLYGKKSAERYHRDIEILLKATPNRRNYFFLAQSYMSINDFEHGFLYNKKYLELPYEENIDERIVYTRIAYCAIQCKKDVSDIIPVLQKVMDDYQPPYLDAYIYFFKYCIENQQAWRAIPYIKSMLEMKKEENGLVSHHFYDYVRFHLISIVCLMTNQHLDWGYEALQKILSYQNPNDLHNVKIYKKLLFPVEE